MSTAALFTIDSATHTDTQKIRDVHARPWVRFVSLLLADFGALFFASALTAGLLHPSMAPFFSWSEVARLIVFFTLFCAIGLYSTKMMHPAVELRKLICAAALATVVLTTIQKHSLDTDAQAEVVIGFLAQTICLTLSRTLLRASLIRLGVWLTPTVIVGSGPLAQTLVHLLEKHKHIGLKPVAILSDPVPPTELYGSRLLVDHVDNAEKVRHQHGISHAIIADPHLTGKDLDFITRRYTQCFEHVTFVPSHPAIGSLSVNAVDLGGFLGLEVPRTHPNWSARVSKRLLDLLLASTAMVFALPVLILLYLGVRLSSPGPVFYGQRRIGRNGHYFTAWKFRSMVTNADAVLEQHLARDPELRRQWELTHKLPNDPRVLPVGKFLRKTSLDELPQLWNVIRGEMSLVGPRPIVDAEVPRYGDCFDYYKMVRPGVTGMWQISGRSNTSYAERVRYDEYFVKNWSVWLDLYILFRTVKTVLLREGAC
jgi:Undecaprenyl-phosphate galactose phosphotransferase WbaP